MKTIKNKTTAKKPAKKKAATKKPAKKTTKKKSSGKVVRNRVSKTAAANKANQETTVKRGRGRPRKNPLPTSGASNQSVDVLGQTVQLPKSDTETTNIVATVKAYKAKPISAFKRVDENDIRAKDQVMMSEAQPSNSTNAVVETANKTKSPDLEVMTDKGAVMLADALPEPKAQPEKQAPRSKATVVDGMVVMDAIDEDAAGDALEAEAATITLEAGALVVHGPKGETDLNSNWKTQ